jgi:prepilin-type N-terminal cleavage/methylation domain-containing protein
MRTKGFTMIELLVVISIIALLAAFVSTELITARTKGADQAAKTTFKQVFSQAEIYRNDNGGFGSGSGATTDVADCVSGFFNDPQMSVLKASILRNAAPAATFTCSTSANGQLWAMSVSALRGGVPWCIDNSGNYKSSTALAGVCP